MKLLQNSIFLTFLMFMSNSVQSQKDIEGVSPGQEFKYGVHEFKWISDDNKNKSIDINEVKIKRKNKWDSFDVTKKKNDTRLFSETIVYRRQQRFFESDCYIYKKTTTRDLMLYVDYPEDWTKTDKRPAIIWFFGGGWNSGNVLHLKPQSDYFAARGIVGIRVDYRVTMRDGFKDGGYTATLDAKTAVRWVRKNATSLGIDPDRILAAGASAGGHMAIATQLPEVNDTGDDLSIPMNVSGMILQNPYVVKLNPDSWVFQLDLKKLPPIWVAYGTKDRSAYLDNAEEEKSKMNGETFIKKLKSPYKTFIQEGAGHGFCSSGKYLAETTLDADKFLQKANVIDKGEATLPEVTMYELKRRLNNKIAKGEVNLAVPKTGIPVHSSIKTKK